MIPYFVGELKQLKYDFDINRQKGDERGFRYNLTLFRTKYFSMLNDTLSPEDQKLYYEGHPIHLFNSDQHYLTLVMSRYLLMPAIDDILLVLEDCIKSKKDEFSLIFQIIIYVYFSCVALFYLFIWKFLERNVGKTIIKAKNMLTIIPKEILVSLDSIYILFKINTNFESEEDEVKENKDGK